MAELMIRAAHLGDMDQLLEWGAAFHESSPWHTIPFDPESMAASFANFIESPDRALIISEYGAIGGLLAPLMFNGNARIAYEAFWYASKNGRHLLKAFEAWAEQQGATHVAMASLETARKAALSRLYSRSGYTPTEQFYLKEIS